MCIYDSLMDANERRIMKCNRTMCDPSCGKCDDRCECPECGMDYRQALEPGTVYICSHCGTELMQRGNRNELETYWGDFWTEDEGDTAPRVMLTRGETVNGLLRSMFTASMEAAAGRA